MVGKELEEVVEEKAPLECPDKKEIKEHPTEDHNFRALSTRFGVCCEGVDGDAACLGCNLRKLGFL